jgi:uncharacterized SAM-binding protein YcdF (DUF218 family)
VDLYVVVKALAVPPGAQALLGLLGLLLYPRWRRLGLACLATAVLSLTLMSMPLTAGWLAEPLEPYPPLQLDGLDGPAPDAIVVLGGGAYQMAPEFNGRDEVSNLTLERLRYAARLQRLTGLPLAVTGGITGTLETPEGELMARSLTTDFGVHVRWRETSSRNTAENARDTRALLPVDRIILVTHAVHMARARRAFEDAGFTVIAAPLAYIAHRGGEWSATDLLPSVRAYAQAQYALYERCAALWYRYAHGGPGA